MQVEAIILRPAEASDAEGIWEVVHAEGIAWSIEEILKDIARLFVLTYQKRILAVLCGIFTPGRESVSWVKVHPMYPESSIQLAMIQTLWGVLCRRPLNDRGWERRKTFSLEKWFGADPAVSSHYKNLR